MLSKEKIKQDLTLALKGKMEAEISVLRQLLAVILNKEKEKRYKIGKGKPGLTEEELVKESSLVEGEIVDVISSEAKKRKESISEFEKGGRQELVQKEKSELEVLMKYLPEQMSEEELKKLSKEAIEKVGAESQKDMGKVMAELMPKVKGKADGGLISKTVKDLLGF
ncbi:MAG: GatB/YqeY domain-containing protein [Candidatus Nealsonbacteria bacterium]